jgi:hypothetical protein
VKHSQTAPPLSSLSRSRHGGCVLWTCHRPAVSPTHSSAATTLRSA